MAKKTRDRQRTDSRRIPARGSGKLDRTPGPPTPPPSREGHAPPTPEETRARLLRERDTAAAALARRGVAIEAEERAGRGEIPFDAGDVAQASEQLDMSFMQRERLAERINRLTRALERLTAGNYGVCEECGRSIDPARLAVAPEVSLCRECQERRERGHQAA